MSRHSWVNRDTVSGKKCRKHNDEAFTRYLETRGTALFRLELDSKCVWEHVSLAGIKVLKVELTHPDNEIES